MSTYNLNIIMRKLENLNADITLVNILKQGCLNILNGNTMDASKSIIVNATLTSILADKESYIIQHPCERTWTIVNIATVYYIKHAR